MYGYFGQMFKHPVVDPNTSGISTDTPDIVFGLPGHRPETPDLAETLKKMFLSGLCGSQVFAYKYTIISLNIHVIYLHPQIILLCMPQNNTQSSISHV